MIQFQPFNWLGIDSARARIRSATYGIELRGPPPYARPWVSGNHGCVGKASLVMGIQLGRCLAFEPTNRNV
jgi:hypothetical protein